MVRNSQKVASLETESVTPAQDLAIGVLIAGGTSIEAAKAAGVNRKTIHAWQNKDHAFITELGLRRRDQRDQTVAALRALANDAVAVVRDAMNAETSPMAIRLRAAQAVLQAAGIGDPEPIPPSGLEAELAELERLREQAKYQCQCQSGFDMEAFFQGAANELNAQRR